MLPWPELSRPVHLPSLFSPLRPPCPVASAFLLASHFRANLSGTSHGFIRDGDGHLCGAALALSYYVVEPRQTCTGRPGQARPGQYACRACLSNDGWSTVRCRSVLLPLSTMTKVSNWRRIALQQRTYYRGPPSFWVMAADSTVILSDGGAENSPEPHVFVQSSSFIFLLQCA